STTTAIGIWNQERDIFAYTLAPFVGVLLVETAGVSAGIVYFLDIGFSSNRELAVFIGRKQDGCIDQDGYYHRTKLKCGRLHKRFPLFVPNGIIQLKPDKHEQRKEQIIGHLDVVRTDFQRKEQGKQYRPPQPATAITQ